MYEAYFNLKERPYSISPDPRFIYLTSQHQEALAKAQYAISEKMGLTVIFGDIGTGKTSLARRLLQQFQDDPIYNLALIVHPNFPSPFQLIREIRREFGSERPYRSLTEELNAFQQFLSEQHGQNKSTLLIVDEAQTLKPPLFEVLRQLLNYETNVEKLLQIVLFGQNQLAAKLDRLPELKDRVTIFGALSSLSKGDMDALIDFRWKVAGGSDHPFSDDALDAIFRFSAGRPRQLCKLCDNALIIAFTENVAEINAKVIDRAAQEMRLNEAEAAVLPSSRHASAPVAEVVSQS